MKIECLIRRRLGSTVTLDGITYEFGPEQHVPDAPHVCEVKDERHQRILLSNESFAQAGAPRQTEKPLPPPPKPEGNGDKGDKGDNGDNGDKNDAKSAVDKMTKNQLIEHAATLGIQVDKTESKNAILNKVRQAEHGNA